MPYHVYAHSGSGAIGIIVETAGEALAKMAELFEDGHSNVVFKDMLGNVVDHASLVALADSERGT